jgi:hypothetical protein
MRDETAREAVQPIYVRFEQGRQSVGLPCRHGLEDARDRPFVHTLLNA